MLKIYLVYDEASIAYIFNRLESIVTSTLKIMQPKTDNNVKQTVRGTADFPYSQLSTLIFVVDTYTAIQVGSSGGAVLREVWGPRPPHSKVWPLWPPNEVHHVGILTEVSAITSHRIAGACQMCRAVPASASMAPPLPPPPSCHS